MSQTDYTYKYERIVIVGAGGVGFWTVVGLSREKLTDRIHVYDDDRVDGSGGSRLPIPESMTRSEIQLHKSKVDVLRDFIQFTLGEPVKGYPQWSNNKLGVSSLTSSFDEQDLVVDCTDMSTEDRAYLFSRQIQMGTYMRISYDGNGWIVIAKGLPLGSPQAVGYTVRPNFAESLAAGGLGASAILQAMRQGLSLVNEYQINIHNGETLSTYGGLNV